MDALEKVLRLPAVHSKRFLTSKVDRCVTGSAYMSPVLLCLEKSCVATMHIGHGRGTAAESGLAINSI